MSSATSSDFEERYGYLSGGHVRDKDAVNAVMLACAAAAWYAAQGMSLLDAVTRCTRSSASTATRSRAIRLRARAACTRCKASWPNCAPTRPRHCRRQGGRVTDYEHDDTGLPKADVLEYRLKTAPS